MRSLVPYLKDYYHNTPRVVWWTVTCITAFFIYINYHYGLDDAIRENSSYAVKLICFYGVFATAFLLPYTLYALLAKRRYTASPGFTALALLAPLFFAAKLSASPQFHFSDSYSWNHYWNSVVYWPLLLVLLLAGLWLTWRKASPEIPFYGHVTKGIYWKPYFQLLALMVPLIALASTQADFLAMYPKIQSLQMQQQGYHLTIFHKLLYELAYGSDFISIEVFFRGFLVLAFVKWAGRDAILPMACYYCTIHFGKPLGECISSYFGGMILGVIVYHSRSIYGGLMIHLGVAWLMELGGHLGHFFRN